MIESFANEVLGIVAWIREAGWTGGGFAALDPRPYRYIQTFQN